MSLLWAGFTIITLSSTMMEQVVNLAYGGGVVKDASATLLLSPMAQTCRTKYMLVCTPGDSAPMDRALLFPVHATNVKATSTRIHEWVLRQLMDYTMVSDGKMSYLSSNQDNPHHTLSR